MKDILELQTAKQLLHHMARYMFEHDSGEIDEEFCLPQIAAGRCPFADAAAGECKADVCAECLIAQFSERKDNA